MKVNRFGVRGDDDCVDLFVSLYQHHNGDGPERIGKADLEVVLAQCVRFFSAATTGLHFDMEPSSDAYAMVRRIYDLRDRISRVRVYLLTNGVTGIRRQLLKAKPLKSYGLSVQIWDIERLFRCIGSGMPREAIEIDFESDFGAAIPCLPMPTEADDYMAYLAIFPGDVLYSLYDDYGSRLLELNVRSFLQLRGKVNSGIRDTLRSEPQNFFAFNNGIAATADAVETVRTPDGSLAVKRIVGLQIVNGGRTTASIHRAKRQDKDDLSRVFVQAKITVANPELLPELVPKVARFANSQNKVQDADFSANDPFHVELQRHSEAIWAPGEQSRWFYERARGRYRVLKAREATTPARRKAFEDRIPAKQVITKTDLAKYVQAWDQRPEIVGRGSQKKSWRSWTSSSARTARIGDLLSSTFVAS